MRAGLLPWLPIVGTLAGVVIGGFVGEVRGFFQERRERRRVRRKLLYRLLDLWYSVKVRDIDALIGRYEAKIAAGFQLPAGGVREFLASHPELRSKLAALQASRAMPSRLERKYQDAVDELAPVDPLLAYYLSGKGKLAQVEEPVADLMEPLLGAAVGVDHQVARALLVGVDKHFSKRALDEALKGLSDDIRVVAKTLGGSEVKGVEKALQRADERAVEQIDDWADEYVAFVRRFAASITPPS